MSTRNHNLLTSGTRYYILVKSNTEENLWIEEILTSLLPCCNLSWNIRIFSISEILSHVWFRIHSWVINATLLYLIHLHGPVAHHMVLTFHGSLLCEFCEFGSTCETMPMKIMTWWIFDLWTSHALWKIVRATTAIVEVSHIMEATSIHQLPSIKKKDIVFINSQSYGSQGNREMRMQARTHKWVPTLP